MNIYLIRHGEQNNSGVYDPGAELTPAGLRQSNLLGWRLQSAGIFRIYTSDQTAAQQTAEAITRHLHREVILMPQFREVGIAQLGNQSDCAELFRSSGILETAGGLPVGVTGQDGEGSGADINRAYTAIEEIAESGLDAVVVTHAGTILSLICSLMGFSQEKRGQICLPEYCSICKINHTPPRGFTILSINDTAHLT